MRPIELTWWGLIQAVAFLHGHSTSWHSANMTMSMAGLRWERLQGYHDLNRVMDLWSTNLLDLQPVPYADPVAEGGDVYNGSFVRGQVSSQLLAPSLRSPEPGSCSMFEVAILATLKICTESRSEH